VEKKEIQNGEREIKATQEHSTELQYAGCQKSHQTTDNSKLTIGYFTALQIEEIQLHPPEYQHKLP